MVGNEGQFATDAGILLRCGAGAAAAIKVAGWFDTIVVDVEAVINCTCRFDWLATDTATTLNAAVRGILVDTACCLAAIEGINWDMSGYTSRIEAEDMVNILRDIALRNLSILRDEKTQSFIKNA